ncbi:MAG: (deoxy)nucleoside triphosphate pyrophosphohydrolase [Acidobacteria bacterium]|nr:(deoxy)nucleoside triphosphate pyrophosphohydrolase [Acidobacteriota bacterium]
MTSPLLVTAAVIVQDGRVLLARRRPGDHQGGCWEFPGGKLHAAEDPAAGLAREIREELAVEVDVLSPLTFIYWEYPEKQILLLFYLSRIRSGVPQPVECAAVEWFDAAALARLSLAAADRAVLPVVLPLLTGEHFVPGGGEPAE